jgi:leucyl/phenylalanyl-tRNA--protein transferase
MFATITNSSKFALIHLINVLKKNGYRLIDCQMKTAHLTSMGARELSGKEFQYLLNKHIQSIAPDGVWNHDTSNTLRNM